MPHIILTAPPQFVPPTPWKDILISLTHTLTNLNPTFQLGDCKARVVQSTDAVVGAGEPGLDHIVIALEVKIMPGRPEGLLRQVAPALRDQMTVLMAGVAEKIEITVDLQELGGPRYAKGILNG
ncbi:hypothetical protein EBR57_09045 [bacterium]|nr:hypothetical protein [bacterium]